jgi:SAM-dependent methyltransferase
LLQLGGDSDLRIRLGEEAGKFVQSFHISENVKSLFSTIVFSFGKERDTFNLVGQKSDKWTKRTEAAVALLSYLPRSGKPLVIGDFGCGDGKVLRTLNEKAGVSFDYFGYDLIPQQDKVTKMDFSKDFPDKTFDLVFSLGLVEYLEKINFYFSNLSKHCGHVILSCIISDTGHYTKQQATNNGWVNYLSSTDLVKIITENNFEILESKILDNGVTYLAILKNKNVN